MNTDKTDEVCSTTWVRMVEVLGARMLLPLYVAVMACEPAEKSHALIF
jgi:hypothetical protein